MYFQTLKRKNTKIRKTGQSQKKTSQKKKNEKKKTKKKTKNDTKFEKE